MKRNDTGDFCILYLEPDDDRNTLLRVIIGQHKHIVLMLAEQSKLFQRPEEFVAFKHIRRQLDISIFFVIVRGERVTQLAERNGFPVYRSLDALTEALKVGRPVRQRVHTSAASKPASPAVSSVATTAPISRVSPVAVLSDAPNHTPRKTIPLKPMEQDVAEAPTRPAITTPPPAVRPAMSSPSAPSAPVPQRHVLPNPVAVLPRPEPVMPAKQTSLLADVPTRPGALRALPITPPPLPSITVASQGMMPPPSPQRPKRSKRSAIRLPRVLLALMMLALSAAGLASLLVFLHAPTMDGLAAPQVIGHVYFLSSGQVNENTNQGYDNEVRVDLSNLANAAAGKKYYAWLLGDKNLGEDAQELSLGVLQVNNGSAHLYYGGDQQHTNLLAITSRFLVTEESAAVPPTAPSPDFKTWRYYGEFLQTSGSAASSMAGMDPTTHYSFLDHLRYLLAADPMLDQNQLPGGLNKWLYLNTEKVLAWTGSMNGAWEQGRDIAAVRLQTVRTLTYLDGLSYVSQDIPPNTALDLNDRLARIGLIDVNGSNQDPPSYLDSIAFHLNGLLQAKGTTSMQRNEVAALLTALNNVRDSLAQVRKDGQQIMQMSDAQLLQPSTLALINHMIANASNAYTGQMNPTTNQMRQGVHWLHAQMQDLATLAITPYQASGSPMQMIPPNIAGLRHEGRV